MSTLEIADADRAELPRTFELTMLTVILVAIAAFTFETLPGLPPNVRLALLVVEYVTVAVFTVEYCVRIAAARRKLAFVFSFYGIVDLLAVLPFYMALVLGAPWYDLRALRILRVFVLFRALKLARYSRALGLFGDALREVREQLILYLMATAFLIYLASAAIYYFEHEAQPEAFQSIFHSLWWSVVTLTTVGYGDTFPVTVGGRVFTGFLLLIGVGVIAVPSGLIASGLATARQKERPAEDS